MSEPTVTTLRAERDRLVALAEATSTHTPGYRDLCERIGDLCDVIALRLYGEDALSARLVLPLKTARRRAA